MPEEQQIAVAQITKSSVFKIKDLYEFFYNLVSSLGYMVIEDHFVKKEDDTAWEWSCLKWVDDYFQFKIWAQVKVLGAKSVKVKREGLSEDMEKADVRVKIKGRIVTDWQARWGTNPLTKFLKGVYDKYLLGSTVDSRKKELSEKVFLLENELKSFFDLPRFI